MRAEAHPDLNERSGDTWEAVQARADALLAAQGVRAHTVSLLWLLGIEPKHQDARAQERLAAVMRRLGWRHDNVRVMGAQGKGYAREGSGRLSDLHLKVVDGVTLVERHSKAVTA